MDRYNRHSFGQAGIEPPTFDTVARVGSKAPDFSLLDLEGRKFSLSQFSGQNHVILEFGNIT